MFRLYFIDNDITSLLKKKAQSPLNCFSAVSPVDEFVYNEAATAPSVCQSFKDF